MSVLSLTAAAYARMMKLLLPPGRLWLLSDDNILTKALLGAADELERISGRASDLADESNPDSADELLPEYEAELGLAGTGTDDERRGRIVAKYVFRQRVRPVDYQQALAVPLGLDAEDVVVIENDRADAIAVDDDREIFKYHIYRDPNLPGSYDVAGAQEVVDSIQHSHVQGKIIESIGMICDDPHSLCDRDLLAVEE